MEPKASELKNGRIKSVPLDSSDDANWLCLPPFLLSFAVSVELARKIGVYISHRQTVRGGNNLLFISVATLCVVNFQKKTLCVVKKLGRTDGYYSPLHHPPSAPHNGLVVPSPSQPGAGHEPK
jgi:hypothetical protein